MSAQATAPGTPSVDPFATPASAERIRQVCEALRGNGFAAEVVESPGGARERVRELVPSGSTVLTAASETLRMSGIEDDFNQSELVDSVRNRVHALDRRTERAAIRRLIATPDFVIGSVSAVTYGGSLVAVSASGSQLPAYAGGAGQLILVVGAQKIVADLPAAFRRIEEYALPLETERTKRVYGVASAVNKILIVNRDFAVERTTIVLISQAIGF